MNQYNNFIAASIKKNYSNSAIFDEAFLDYFFKSRSNFINNILKINKTKFNKKIDENKDKLLSFLKKKTKKNKILKKDEKIIIKLYKRFNIYLKISREKKKN